MSLVPTNVSAWAIKIPQLQRNKHLRPCVLRDIDSKCMIYNVYFYIIIKHKGT